VDHLTAEAYARQLKALLPPGRLWRLEPTSVLSKILQALADELARVDSALADLIDEWDPSTTSDLLADWERILGLPDGTYIPSADPAQRRLQVVAKYGSLGGQTAAFFVALAARLGMTSTVEETDPHTWVLHVTDVGSFTVRVEHAAIGSHIGDLLGSTSVPELETPVLRGKPAHTIVYFTYP
jgi:uncharacterized protein YmfQ (DUF2313 family)